MNKEVSCTLPNNPPGPITILPISTPSFDPLFNIICLHQPPVFLEITAAEILSLQKSSNNDNISAAVISRKTGGWWRQIILNKGSKDADIKVGDFVSSSPASTLLPPNIPIGIVQSIDETLKSKKIAKISLSAKPHVIDWVQILKANI